MERVVIDHFKKRFHSGAYSANRIEVSIPRANGKLLDVGCGAIPTYPLRQFHIYGLDIVKPMTHSFKKACHHAEVILADGKTLPFKDASFEIVVANVLLHHLIAKTPQGCIFNIERFLHSLPRILKPNGIIVIRELVFSHQLVSIISFYVTLLCARLGIEIAFLDIHSGVITFFLSESTFEKMLSENCWKIAKKTLHGYLFARIKQLKNVEYCIVAN